MRLPAILLSLATVVPAFAAQSDYNSASNPQHRPMLGVQMTPVPLSVQEQQNLPPNQGVLVQSVYDNSAARTMGLQAGDVITGVNGMPIGSMSDLRNEVWLNQVGDPVQVTIRRNGQEQVAEANLKPWPANVPYDPIDPAMEDRFRKWQERRLARMQNDVDQLQQQAQALARQEAEEEAATANNQFGIKAQPVLDANGQPIAWRFNYGIAGVPEQEATANTPVDANGQPIASRFNSGIAGVPEQEITATTPVSALPDSLTVNNARSWHFMWTLNSQQPSQEPL